MKYIIAILLSSIACIAQTNVIVPNPQHTYGTGGTAPFCGVTKTYSTYVLYTKSAQQGWGWTPHSGPLIAFVGTNQSNTTNIITYLGEYGDSGCGLNGLCTLPYPAYSPAYRFSVYRTDGVTNQSILTNQTVTIIGFNP